MTDPAREAFRSFGLRLGVLVTFDDDLARPLWVMDSEAQVLVVPGRFTPQEQGALGAALAMRMLSRSLEVVA